MWRKTVVRRASKYMPRSCEAFEKAVAFDNLSESGHDVDIQDGEVIDITAMEDEVTFDAETGEIIPEPEPEPTPQVDALAEKIRKPKVKEAAPTVAMLDAVPSDDGSINWGEWAREAYKILKTLDGPHRKAWQKAHAALLAEAEMVVPTAVEHVNKLINEGA
jgi:hypothetical protein